MRYHVSVTSSSVEDYKADCEIAVVVLDEPTCKAIKDKAEVAKAISSKYKSFNAVEFFEPLCLFLDYGDAVELFPQIEDENGFTDGIYEAGDELADKLASCAQNMDSVVLRVDERYAYFLGHPKHTDMSVESQQLDLKELD